MGAKPPSRVRIPLSPPKTCAPVAQLDRVSGYEPEGRRFESFRAHHFLGKSPTTRCIFMKLFSYGISFIFLASVGLSIAYADSLDDELSAYCIQSGGQVEAMQAEFSTPHGMVHGLTKQFCEFKVDCGTLSIGLETFSSAQSNIAATYAKTLAPLDKDSPLWAGGAGNPSFNVCKNLGGASIGSFSSGGFANALGQSDICVFGDASMISAWSLIYMANHRNGYNHIKVLIKSVPL